MRCPEVFRGGRLPHTLNVAAAILIVLGVLYKAIGVLFIKGGVGIHNAPFGVSPRAFLLLAGIFLLFGIAMNLQRLADRKASATLTPSQPADAESENSES